MSDFFSFELRQEVNSVMSENQLIAIFTSVLIFSVFISACLSELNIYSLVSLSKCKRMTVHRDQS